MHYSSIIPSCVATGKHENTHTHTHTHTCTHKIHDVHIHNDSQFCSILTIQVKGYKESLIQKILIHLRSLAAAHPAFLK